MPQNDRACTGVPVLHGRRCRCPLPGRAVPRAPHSRVRRARRGLRLHGRYLTCACARRRSRGDAPARSHEQSRQGQGQG
ncbi:MAG: hypothetical protein ACK559_16130, partial [bacterium]